MEAVVQARAALEAKKEDRNEEERKWESICIKAISRRCGVLEAAVKKKAQSTSVKGDIVKKGPEPDKEQVKKSLAKFYGSYNKKRLKDLDKIVQHFEGRFDDLNESLLLQYGEGLSKYIEGGDHLFEQVEAKYRVDPVQEELNTYRELFTESVQEFQLPSNKYKFRSCSGKAMIGLKDFWLELLQGLIRTDICLRTRKVGKKGIPVTNPEFAFRTEKPIKLKCRILGLKVVENVAASSHTSADTGKTYYLDSVNMDAEVSFALVFVWSNRGGKHRAGWRPCSSFKFEISKLKTQRPVTDQVLRTVANASVPHAIKKALLKVLPSELANILKHPDVIELNKTKPVGFAMATEIKLTGWPTSKEFTIDLVEAMKNSDNRVASSILKKLEMSKEQLETLAVLNRSFGSRTASSSRTQPWQRGVFPLDMISIQELISLRKGLFMGDLISTTGENEESGGEDVTDEELSGTDVDSSDEEEYLESDSEGFGHIDEDSSVPATSVTPPVSFNEFRNEELDKEFAREYSNVVSCAARAQAVVQAKLDSICDAANVSRWSLYTLIEKIDAAVCQKQVTAELHVHAIDLRLDLDVLVQVLENYFFALLRRQRRQLGEIRHNVVLRELHKIFASTKISLFALKTLFGSLRFALTGALTGGRCPAFEFSLKDISSEGVIDMQLTTFRLGGSFPEFLNWFKSLVHLMRHRRAMSKTQKKQSTAALVDLKQTLMKHVEILQFFVLGSFSIADPHALEKGESSSLVLAISAQEDDPRPALSLQVLGDMMGYLPKARTRSCVSERLTEEFVFPFESAVSGGQLASILFSTKKNRLMDLVKIILRDKGVCDMKLKQDDAFNIYGFAKYVFSLLETGLLDEDEASMSDAASSS